MYQKGKTYVYVIETEFLNRSSSIGSIATTTTDHVIEGQGGQLIGEG